MDKKIIIDYKEYLDLVRIKQMLDVRTKSIAFDRNEEDKVILTIYSMSDLFEKIKEDLTTREVDIIEIRRGMFE